MRNREDRDDQNKDLDRGTRYLKLYIGGGFQSAGLKMRKEVKERGWEHLIRTIFLDTDSNNLEYLRQAEKLILDDVRAADVLEAIAEYKERFPGWEILGDLEEKWRALGAAESLPAGLMTRRELGVLVLLCALWRRPAEVRNFLLAPARELHKVTPKACWQPNQATLRQHDLITSYHFSSNGGTGSSESLLFVDLHRDILSTDGGFSSVQFVAHILLPGPMLHRAIDPDALKANTWAFFLELMQRYDQKLEPLQLATYTVSRNKRQFQLMMAYDENNSRQQIYTNRAQINEVVNECEKLMTLGFEGREFQARLADYQLTFPNVFSSAGCWIMSYPHAIIQEAFALRSGIQWLDEVPLKRLDVDVFAQVAQERYEDFLQRHGSLRDFPELARDEQGRPLHVNLTPVANVARQKLPGAIEDTALRQLQEHSSMLSELVQLQNHRLQAVIIAEVEALLAMPGGIDLAVTFLNKLFGLLQSHKETLEDQVERARHERKQRTEQLSFSNRPGWLGRFAFNYRKRYLKRAQRAKDVQLRELRQQARLELAKQLIVAMQQLKSECSTWREVMEGLQQKLDARLEEHWHEAELNRPVCEEWVVCRDEIDAMFDAQQREVMAQAGEGLRLSWESDEQAFLLGYQGQEGGPATRWSVASPVGVEKHTAYFRRFWSDRVDRSVEDILTERGESPEDLLAYLAHNGAPLIKIDDTTQIPAEMTLMILGSESKRFWRNQVGRTGLSIAATGNPHRVSLLYTVHGFNPLTGLMQSKAWKKAYEDAIAEGRSPHVFPDMAINLDDAMGGSTSSKKKGGKNGAEA